MLTPYTRDVNALHSELDAFELMLQPLTALHEKADIMPFFRRSSNLAAYLGYANNNLISPNLLGIEHDLMGFPLRRRYQRIHARGT